MPSSNACVQHIRATLSLSEYTDVLPHNEWWTSGPDNFKRIPYESIAHHADNEYLEWKSVNPLITHTCTMDAQLRDWIRTTPDDVLCALLDDTPIGVGAGISDPSYEFTPWQRLSMVVYLVMPFAFEAVVQIDVEHLHTLARYTQADTRRRQIPMKSHVSMMGGTMPDYGIIDLPTAGGKTGWALSVALMAVSDARFPQLVQEYRDKRKGKPFQGSIDVPIARLVLVAAAASTFHHFLQTLERLLPLVQAMQPTTRFTVWSKMSKFYGVDVAKDVDGVVLWIIPVQKLNTVLRQDPKTAVAVCITDEFTVDTPRESGRTLTSPIAKQMITQATPQALVNATSGGRTWLKQLFQGTLIPPKRISEEIRRHNFSQAQLACEQLCLLDCMTLTSFRDRVRRDLCLLVPPSLEVHFVRSRVVSMSAHILNSHVDMVPANLSNVILHYLGGCGILTTESIAQVRSITSVMDPTSLITIVSNVESTSPHNPMLSRDRLVERIQEFVQQCPICLSEASPGMKLYGCCGYCVCQNCYDVNPRNRCPFCRTDVPQSLPRNVVVEEEPEAVVPFADDSYPERPAFDGDDMTVSMNRVTGRDLRQITNLTNALHCLKHYGYSRVLLVIERTGFHGNNHFEDHFDCARLSEVTGFDTRRVDQTLRGKGSEFAVIKANFDAKDTVAKCLVSFGIDADLLVGTNFDCVDAMVMVGHVSNDILTQTLGRTFRPRADRDNTRPMKMVKIYTGRVSLRRRPRE